MPQLMQLWRGEVVRGRQDVLLPEDRLQRMLGRFDWDTRSRVIESSDRLVGSVLVMARPSPEGVLANVYAAGEGDSYLAMVGWGVAFGKAAGAATIQVFVGKGQGGGLESTGLQLERPWLRMDRDISDGLPEARPVDGYELADASTAARGLWSDLFNRTFADHWRFAPREEEESSPTSPRAVPDGRERRLQDAGSDQPRRADDVRRRRPAPADRPDQLCRHPAGTPPAWACEVAGG
jgi:hypothetical protein